MAARKVYDTTKLQLRDGIVVEEARIPAGSSLSEAIVTKGRTVKTVVVPAGTEGARLRFLRGFEPGGPWYPARDTEGDPISVVFVAGEAVELHPGMMLAVLSLKLQTVASDGVTPVAQSGADAALLVQSVPL